MLNISEKKVVCVLSLVVIFGGSGMLFFPDAASTIFGWNPEETHRLFQQLFGLGVICGGFLLFRTIWGFPLAVYETLSIGGFVSAILFFLHSSGYDVGRVFLLWGAIAVGFVGLLRVWREK